MLDDEGNEFKRTAFDLINPLPLPITMEINSARRFLNSRLHTAGHLLDIVLMDIMKLPLTVLKAYHFPAGPHILYSGHIAFKDDKDKKNNQIPYTREEFLRTAEEHCNTIIANNPRSIIRHASPDDDYAMRWMSIEGYPREIACGGTHVPHLGLLGPCMKIRKVQVKSTEKTVRVSYDLD